MRSLRPLVIGMLGLVGCKKAAPRFEGPMPIEFGDCAGAATTWVSGPRAVAFTLDEAELVRTAAIGPPGSPLVPMAPIAPPDADAASTGSMAAERNVYGGLLPVEGATGSGFGTIGSSRTGAGYGLGRTYQVPTLSMGQPQTQGDLDKAIIRRYIRRHVSKLEYCYEKRQLAKPSIAGIVATKFTIAPDGTVKASSATGVDPEVATCVADVIKTIEFPKPKNGATVEVSFPFTFRPGDTTHPVPQPEPVRPPPPPKPTRQLFRSSYRDAEGYDPGGANPLRLHGAALSECMRGNPKHAGVMVIELAYDAGGAVTTGRVHGIDDEATNACVAAVARLAKAQSAAIRPERCSIAFGQLAVTDLPAIEIAKDAVAFGGKPIAQVPALMKDDAPAIAELTAALDARVRSAIGDGAPVVALHGPLVLRPDAATPMKVVDRAIGSVLAAGDDLVLATNRTTGWELLAPMRLPAVPVPIGTGTRWGHVKSLAAEGNIDDEHVTLSLLVTPERIWIGLSRVNEFIEVAADANQLDKLASQLKDKKVSAFFADRDDLEIAAEATVPYERVVKIIEIATAAGFRRWMLTDAKHLAATPTL